MIIKLIIQTFDMPDTSIVTAKQGDIVNVTLDNGLHEGNIVRREKLIVKVDIGNFLTNVNHLVALRMEHLSGDLLWPPSDGAAVIVLKKRRYRIPWNELISKSQTLFGIVIDMGKLLDPSQEYQPLENVTFSIASLIEDKVRTKKLAVSDFNAIKNAIG